MRGRDVVAIEVKSARRFQERDLSGLKAFLAKTPGVRAALLAYNVAETVRLGDRLHAIPIAAMLS